MASSTLAGDEMHIVKLSNAMSGALGPQYKVNLPHIFLSSWSSCTKCLPQVVPAIARDGDDVPVARAGHSACVIDSKIVVYGGYGQTDSLKPLDEGGRVWIFDPKTLHWTHLDVANESFPSRYCHGAAAHGNSMILHGGYSGTDASAPETDSWRFDLATRVWTQLPALNPDVKEHAPR